MSKKVDEYMANNQEWAEKQLKSDPDYFKRIASTQEPKYMWIGCADSRLSCEHILQAEPGEFFVQRNIANLVCHADLNVISAVAFAVEVLKVENIIICGHTRCGGCEAAFSKQEGIVDNWLEHIRDVLRFHEGELNSIEDKHDRTTRLAELNVLHQTMHLMNTSIVQQAWKRGHPLSIHPLLYYLEEGRIEKLHPSLQSQVDYVRLEQKIGLKPQG